MGRSLPATVSRVSKRLGSFSPVLAAGRSPAGLVKLSSPSCSELCGTWMSKGGEDVEAA